MPQLIAETERLLRPDEIPRSDKESLAARILGSQTLQTSRKLQQLLQYIVRRTLDEELDECTEQQIGIQVFGRSPGYNAAEDSIVRSQVRLLRQRLDAFFEGEGRGETLRLEIPRGHYVASFTPQTCPTAAMGANSIGAISLPSHEPSADHAAPASVNASLHRSGSWLWGLAAVVLCAVGSFWLGLRMRGATAATIPASPRLWTSFLDAKDPPLVIFSNAVFVGNGTEGLRYATGDDPGSQPIMDHYTGVGEVASVYDLTRFFDLRQRSFTLKRSRLVTWDDARTRNLIFVGAPLENPSLRVVPDSRDFTFVKSGDAYDIQNLRPLAGEPTLMHHSSWPMTVDYAIVALRPGFEPTTKMLIFAGMTTIGTQAAVEFATGPGGAAQLLPPTLDSRMSSFEAVLMVNVSSGVPISTKIIAMHRSAN